MEGLEYLSDEELLRRSIIREDELERTVREFAQSLNEWNLRAPELERDEARKSVATVRGPYYTLRQPRTES